MPNWADLLLSDEGDGLQQVQDPIARPNAIRRPGEASRQRQAPQRRMNWADEVLRDDEPQQMPVAAAQNQPANPMAEPDAPTWYGRAWQAVRGKQDPRYKDLPTAAEVLLKEGKLGPGSGLGQEQWGWLTGAKDTDMAKVYGPMFGDRFVRQETDANGYPVIVYRDQGGKEARAYVNKPGLDPQDVFRGVVGIAPFAGAGLGISAATKGSALVPRMVMQGMGQAGTSVAQDAAGIATGYTSPTNAEIGAKATAAGIGGAAGEGIAAGIAGLWRKLVAEPSLYNQATGQLTEKGAEVLRRAGLTPDDVAGFADKWAKEYARTGNAGLAASSLNLDKFGLKGTRGQILKDPQLLLEEKAMRMGNYGQPAKERLQDFDKIQQRDLEQMALNAWGQPDSLPTRMGLPSMSTVSPGVIGERLAGGMAGVKQAAREMNDAAWNKVGRLEVTEQAKGTLPTFLTRGLGNTPLDDKLTPTAVSMVRDLETFIEGAAPGIESKLINRAAVKDVGDMRKRLLTIYGNADTSTDKKAAKAIYDSFNDWIDDAAQNALLKGDPMSAAAMRQARSVHREMQQILGPTGQDGKTPGRRILQQILADDVTPERVVSSIFSVDPGATPKAGAVEAIQLIKQGANKYLPPEEAAALIGDLKLAAYQGLVMDSSGKLLTPTMMAKNIDKFMRKQGSIARELFTPEDRQLLFQWARAMKDLSFKDPNPSGSGVAAAFFAGKFGQSFMRLMGLAEGPMAKVVSALMGWSGVQNVLGNEAAKTAIRKTAIRSAPPPALAGPAGYFGTQTER